MKVFELIELLKKGDQNREIFVVQEVYIGQGSEFTGAMFGSIEAPIVGVIDLDTKLHLEIDATA